MAQNTSGQRPMSNYKSGTRAGRAVNDAVPQNTARSSHNKFANSYPFKFTARYGEIAPFFAFNAVARDVIPLKSSFELRSLALVSPKMTPLFMKRSYFEVKHNAILPRTFEYIFKNPIQGDDVPEDAYCNYAERYGIATSYLRQTFTQKLFDESHELLASIDDNPDKSDAINRVIRSLLVLESVYSNGSLLSALGCPLNGYVFPRNWTGEGEFIFDEWITSLLTKLVSKVNVEGSFEIPVFTFPDLVHWESIENSSARYAVELNLDDPDHEAEIMTNFPDVRFISLTRMLEILRSYHASAIVPYSEKGDITSWASKNVSSVVSLMESFDELHFCLPPEGVDISRLAAYQLICAEWYTNDKVDFIYNADLWRKSMDFFARQVCDEVFFFDYNDIAVMYDALSSKVFYEMEDRANIHDDSYDFWLDFLSNLFFYNRSLKFEDYFSGARTSPLATGDNRISDPGDPLDIVRNIQFTRFLNAVNRAGLDEDYLKEIYGTLPAPEDTRPKWIATYDDRIDSFEVNNTAQDQGKMTTALRSYSDDKHEYTAVQVDGYPSILLGLYSFEMPRDYVSAIDRDFFVKDRYDMFNPYYQYDGDQKILRSELYPIVGDAADGPFAFTGRGNQWKMRVGRAGGGFVRLLPSWAFTVNDKQSHLNPEYILSSASEFDRFYSGFAGVGLEGYFHFIISFVNTCNSVRPMEFAPAILNG